MPDRPRIGDKVDYVVKLAMGSSSTHQRSLPLLTTAVMSAANWSETWQKLAQHGVDASRSTTRLHTLGLRVEPVSEADAVTAARLKRPGRCGKDSVMMPAGVGASAAVTPETVTVNRNFSPG